jgi:hypothetical protein
MWHGIFWLFSDPIAVCIMVGIIVSVVQHYREVRLIEKRADELQYLVGRLEMLIRTAS